MTEYTSRGRMIETPSGQKFWDSDIYLAEEMARCGFIRRSDEPFPLKSRIMSRVYVFGREDVTDNPSLEWRIGAKIVEIVRRERALPTGDIEGPTCLIGVPTAGTVLAQAASMVNYAQCSPYYPPSHISHRLMREAKKDHGAHQTWVNGRPNLQQSPYRIHQYWMVDNVATDGGSKLEAAAKLEEDGYPAKEMPCLIFVDRQQGAVKRLKREGFKKIVVIYNLLDLVFVFGELGLWPKETVRQVEEEIQAHQFIS